MKKNRKKGYLALEYIVIGAILIAFTTVITASAVDSNLRMSNRIVERWGEK